MGVYKGFMPVAFSPSLSQRVAVFCAFMAAIAIPLRAFGVAGEQTAMGLSLIAALLLLALDGDARLAAKTAITAKTGVSIALVFVALAVTVPFSLDPLGSLKIAGRTGLFVLGAVVIWAALSPRAGLHALVLKTLMIGAFALSVMALVSLLGVKHIAWLARGDFARALSPGDAFINPIHVFKAFATSAMCLLPVVAWAGRRLDGPWRWWGYAYAPLALSIMVLSYNRSALAGVIAMTVAGLALLALAKRRHRTALLATALAVCGSILAWVSTREIRELEELIEIGKMSPQSSTYLPEWILDPHRQTIWKFAFERFLDHPLVGNGIDQLNRLQGAHTAISGLTEGAYVVPSHPHNWALELLAESGLIGFGAVFCVLAVIGLRLARRYIRTDDDADLALFVLMAGFWGSALFNFSIWAAWWQLTFFILFALVSATRYSRGANGNQTR